jgi:dephospho-CoA kinase
MRNREPKQKKSKIIIGLTGSFGSGKSTVAKIFKAYGAKIIDADKIAHKAIRPHSQIYQKIIKAFGKDILKRDKVIDRRKLADKVFNNKKSLRKLSQIVHPEVIRVIKKEMKDALQKVVVLDAPLLIETGLARMVDKLIVVKINRKEQIKRMQRKFHLKRMDILRRVRSQIPLSYKLHMADFIIDNNGTIEMTKKQVGQIRRLLWRS